MQRHFPMYIGFSGTSLRQMAALFKERLPFVVSLMKGLLKSTLCALTLVFIALYFFVLFYGVVWIFRAITDQYVASRWLTFV